MADDEIAIRFRADTGDFKNGMNDLAGSISNFGKMVGEVFAAEKVYQFIKEGIEGFAEYERVLDRLGNKVRASGLDWNSLKKDVEGYAKQIQETTRFSDDEVVDSLDKLMLRTRNYSESLKLNNLAMRISIETGQPLVDIANRLGMAFENDTKGLAQVARTMGITGSETKSATELFAELEKRVAGTAIESRNLSDSMTMAKNAIEDTKKEIGEELAPAIEVIAKDFVPGLKSIVSGIIGLAQSAGVLIGGAAVQAMAFFDALAKQASSFSDFASNVWKHPIDATKEYFSESKDNFDGYANSLVGGATDMVEEFNKIWSKGEEERKKKHDTTNTEIIISEKTLTEEVKEQLKDRGTATQQLARTVIAAGRDMAVASGDAFSQFVELSKNGLLTLSGAFEILGKAMMKAIVNALGEGLIQEGAKYYAQAMAALISIVGAPTAPGLFAAGTFLAGAGGTMKGVAAAYLAEGGIVKATPGGVHAIIGEGGRDEAVIPLDSGKGIGSNFSVDKMTLNFPGITKASEVQTPRFRKTVERIFAEVNNRTNYRQGRKI